MKKQTGQCYCGTLKYEVFDAPIMKGLCYCAACQVVAGGSPQTFVIQPRQGFRYTHGEPKTFTHPDLLQAVTRDFCETCGTHIATHRLGAAFVVIKVGTLDDPSSFGKPKVAIYTEDMRGFHCVPDGVHAFEKLPPS